MALDTHMDNADLGRRISRLEQDHQVLLRANESLEARNQALEREVLQLRTVQNERTIGTNNAFAEIERDMEETEECLRQMYAALKVVDESIPLGLDWMRSELPFKVRRNGDGGRAALLRTRSRKHSLQMQQGNCPRSVSISMERPIPMGSLEDRLRATEEKVRRLTKGQEVSDRTLAEAQKTLTDLHVNLRPAEVLARKFVAANGWTEKELSHWRTVLAEGHYGSPLSESTAKKSGKTVTIQRDVQPSSPASKDLDALLSARSQTHDGKSRKHMRRKSSSDVLFVPPPGDTRPMSLFYCTIM